MSARRYHRVLAALLSACVIPLATACGGNAAPKPAPKPAHATQPQHPASVAATAPAPQHAPPASKAPARSKTKLKKVKFRLDFFPSGYQAPFVVAEQLGYYKQAGLDVHVGSGKGSAITAQQVASGSATMGFADFGTSAFLIAKGAPIEAVMVPEQGNSMCITSKASEHITKPSQLEGHSIADVIGGFDSYYLPAFLRAAHVPVNSVTIRNLPGAEKLTAFENGRVNAIVGLTDFEIPILRAKGFKLDNICYSKYGIQTITHSVIAPKKLVASDPALIRAFIAATIRGYDYTLKHPKAAVEDVIHQFPSAHLALGVGLAQLKANLKLLHTASTRSKPIGWVSPSEVAGTLNLLKQYAGLKTNLPASAFYTDSLIPSSK